MCWLSIKPDYLGESKLVRGQFNVGTGLQESIASYISDPTDKANDTAIAANPY